MKLIEETGDEELLLELNTLSIKSRISRLEEMFYQCGKYINEVYENTNKRLTVAYSSTIKDNYYQTIFDIHKSIGVGVSFSYIDNDMIKEILALSPYVDDVTAEMERKKNEANALYEDNYSEIGVADEE